MPEDRQTAEPPAPASSAEESPASSSPAEEYLLARLRASRQAARDGGVADNRLTQELAARLDRTRQLIQDEPD